MRKTPETTVRSTTTGFQPSADESDVTFRCRVDDSGFGPCDPSYTLPARAAGTHRFEAFATDRAGNVDPTPAIHTWTIAPQPLSFKLRYATRNGRLTRLAVSELAPPADLRVSVKCPKRKRCPRGFAQWNALGAAPGSPCAPVAGRSR